MRQLYLIAGIAAVAFFSYAQQRGMTLYAGDSASQQVAGQRSAGSGGSSRISHK